MLCSGILWIVGQRQVCTPWETAHINRFIKRNTAVGRQIERAHLLSLDLKVPNSAWRQLCTLVKNLSATCANPVDLEDCYYDRACLDPGSGDAGTLSPDKSDYVGKKTSRVLPLSCI